MIRKREQPRGDYTNIGVAVAVLMAALTMYLGWRAAVLVNPMVAGERGSGGAASVRQYLVYRSYHVAERGDESRTDDDAVRYEFVRVPLNVSSSIGETVAEMTTSGLSPAEGAPWMSKVDDSTLLMVSGSGAPDGVLTEWVDVSGNVLRDASEGLDALMTGLPSPDGSSVAYRDSMFGKIVVEGDSGGMRVFDGPGLVGARPEAWSPDGSKLYFSLDTISEGGVPTDGTQALAVLDIVTGAIAEIENVRKLGIRAHDIDAASGMVAGTAFAGEGVDDTDALRTAHYAQSSYLYLISTRDGSWTELASGASSVFDRPLFSPDGKTVAYTVTSQGVSDVWTADVDVSGHERRIVTGTLLDWTPDGMSLIVDRDNEIQIVSLDDGSVKTVARRSGRYPDKDFHGVDYVGVVGKR